MEITQEAITLLRILQALGEIDAKVTVEALKRAGSVLQPHTSRKRYDL